jgi:hypothetical protein
MKYRISFFEDDRISENADSLYEKEKNYRILQNIIIAFMEEYIVYVS